MSLGSNLRFSSGIIFPTPLLQGGKLTALAIFGEHRGGEERGGALRFGLQIVAPWWDVWIAGEREKKVSINRHTRGFHNLFLLDFLNSVWSRVDKAVRKVIIPRA